MSGANRWLVNCRSMEVSNSLEFIKSGIAGCLLLPISGLTLRPQGGAVVPIIPIRVWEEVLLISQAWTIFPGVVPLTPFLLTWWGVLLVHALPNVSSVNIFFAAGVIGICGASTIVFSSGGWIETSPMVRPLNKFWSKILLLMWVTVSVLIVRSPYASLAFTLFNLYPASFIVKLLIVLTSLSDLSNKNYLWGVVISLMYSSQRYMNSSRVSI